MNKNKINDFLKFWQQILIENRNMDLKKTNVTHIIYNYLIKLGVSDNDKYKNNQEFFSKWIDYFKNKKNINVFISPTWQYFCQFINGDVYKMNNYIKLYIPVDYNHLYRSGIEIFDFLEKNNISHLSKIGQEIRFDNIIVRLTNINDAKRLINFVNNNSYIQEGLIMPNPFSFNINNIAITSDGNISYNRIICAYIRLYLSYMKDNNLIQEINAISFITFIKNLYQSKINNITNNNELFTQFELHNNKELIDLKNITELIISSYKDYSLEDFNGFYNKIISKEQTNYELEDELEINKLLLKALEIMSNKEDKKTAIQRITRLLETDNYNYITNEKNLRYQLLNIDFANKLKIILNKKKINLISYINTIPITKDEEKNLIEKLLEESVQIMSNKYGENTAIENIYYFYKTSNPMFITRDNDLRNRFMTINFKEKVDKLLKNSNMDFKEYLEIIKEKCNINNKKRRQ